MRFQIRKCPKCLGYTLDKKCKRCSEQTGSIHPAKFSPDDKYMKYRLKDKYATATKE
jgi:H/ACA ribonucleoprotein complex subunit 3